MSIYVAFHLGHDSNITASINGKIRYKKSERCLGLKHHRADLNFIFKTLQDWGIKKIDCCAYTRADWSPKGFRPAEQCKIDELFCVSNFTELNCKCFEVDHHYAHSLSVWPIVDTKSLDYSVCMDGGGDWGRNTIIIKSPAVNPIVTHADYGKSLSLEFHKVGQLLGLKGMEYDLAGKLMGLQAYTEEQITQFGVPLLKNTNYKNIFKRNHETLYDFHEYGWEHLKKIFKFIDKNSVVGYSGGCAQNTIYNYRLKQDFHNLHIPPHCYDGGLSLGCIEFLRLQFGEEPFCSAGFPYWQDDQIETEPDYQTITKTANMLADGAIIGWMQGSGEIGPRALGNRSILMSACKGDNKDILNKKVKKREPWRPYAGTILQPHAKEYFDMDESPYMLYACKVLTNNIPAITHVDWTCRMQTIKNGIFYNLIQEYYKLTGVPIILNTSLNIAKKPIASSKQDGMQLLKHSELDAIVIGNKIFKKSKFFI
jgi:carbamoyltransferase